jgi:glycosyltransferase involved in cell wall biosynthesis
MAVDVAQAEKSKLIVVGVPAYNEESTIAKTILRAKKHVSKIVVVDDGSTDDTSRIAESLGATVLFNDRNMGKGQALKTIFKIARELEADVLVTIDADAQHDADDIPKVAEPVLDGTADVAVGARTTGPRFRRVAQKALDIATAVYDKDGVVVDSQSGFRAYSRRAIDRMDFGERGMGVESESLKKASQEGLVIKQVPIRVSYGAETDHTLHPVLHFSDVLSTLAKIALLKRPLRFLGIPAVLMVLFGLFRWIQILNTYNTTREFAIGNALVASVVLIAGFFLGIGAIILLAIRLIVQETE